MYIYIDSNKMTHVHIVMYLLYYIRTEINSLYFTKFSKISLNLQITTDKRYIIIKMSLGIFKSVYLDSL
jgi:hypothetical protein